MSISVSLPVSYNDVAAAAVNTEAAQLFDDPARLARHVREQRQLEPGAPHPRHAVGRGGKNLPAIVDHAPQIEDRRVVARRQVREAA